MKAKKLKYVYHFEPSIENSVMTDKLNELALRGYRVHSMFRNEGGTNTVLFEYAEPAETATEERGDATGAPAFRKRCELAQIGGRHFRKHVAAIFGRKILGMDSMRTYGVGHVVTPVRVGSLFARNGSAAYHDTSRLYAA